MKINDVIVENEQIDELTAGQVGSAVGKGAGAVAKGLGAVAGGVKGAWQAAKKGFEKGRSTVAGDNAEITNNPVEIQKLIRQKEAELKQLQNKLKTVKAAPAKTATAPAANTTQSAPAKTATAANKPPAANTTQAAPAQQSPAPATNKNAAAGDTYEKAKGAVRKVQGGEKPMPPQAAADIQSAIAKLAKGDKESGVFAAQKIMNLAKAGVDVSKQQQAWVANSKAGERFLTQSQYFEISKMLRENNLTWNDLGIRVHLLEGTNKLFGISLK